jgi:hypothetical protein
MPGDFALEHEGTMDHGLCRTGRRRARGRHRSRALGLSPVPLVMIFFASPAELKANAAFVGQAFGAYTTPLC